jgi:enoyl-CoA hydratase
MAKAKYHLMLCEELSGEEAERIGLVSMCVDDEHLQDKALEVAIRLAAGAQGALQMTKHTLNLWYRQQAAVFDAGLAYEFYLFGGPDAAEGLAAHLERRAPSFVNGPAASAL